MSLHAQVEDIFKASLPDRILKADSFYYTLETDTSSERRTSFLLNLKGLAIAQKDEQIQLLAESHLLFNAILNDPDTLEKLVNRLIRIIQICRIQDYPELEMRILCRTAYVMAVGGRTGSSIVYLIQADKLYERTEPRFWVDSKQTAAYNLAHYLYWIGNYTLSKHYALRQHQMQLQAHAAILNSDILSLIYYQLGDLDSAEYFIRKGLNVYADADTVGGKLSGWRGIFEGYRGRILHSKNDYTQALPHILYAVQNTYDANMPNNVASFGLLAADCYVKLGQLEKAKDLLPLINKVINLQVREQCFIDYYKLILVLGEPARNAAETRAVLDSIQLWTERQTKQKDQNAFARNEMELELEHFGQQESKFRQDITRQRILRNFLWGILASAMAISSVLIYRKQRQLVKKDNAIVKAQEELDIFRLMMVEKIRQVEVLENKIGISPTDQELEELRERAILTEEDWTHFKELFERAHGGYLTRLKAKFPDLTSGETRLIALLRLSLNNKEMASILGVGTGAIRTMKSRLLKKLKLPEDTALENVVESL